MFSVPSQIVWHCASRSCRAIGQSSMYPLPPNSSSAWLDVPIASRVARILARGTRIRRSMRPSSSSAAVRVAAAHSYVSAMPASSSTRRSTRVSRTSGYWSMRWPHCSRWAA